MIDNRSMVYASIHHTPIGLAIKRTDGSLALQVRNPRTRQVDEISLETLLETVVQKAKPAESRNEQDLAEK